MQHLTPRQIVAELDRHIIGQSAAKRAVAIALRNRWRWKQLPDEIRREITPKNIILIGPTGVGKTEITRRLAGLIQAPFIKVEATKYTEVGYHGRDVESMVRELVDAAIGLVRRRKRQEVEEQAQQRVEQRILDILLPPAPRSAVTSSEHQEADRQSHAREKFAQKLRDGELEEREIELDVEQRGVPVHVFSNMGMEQMDMDLQNMFEKLMPRQSRRRRVTVAEARKILLEEVADELLDRDAINEEGLQLAEENGILFIDEMDKICESSEGPGRSADVSRQGVQRDLLPIVEGTTVQTRYGSIKTDQILFIAAGAFHSARPADLMPELQGRFPIRVELNDLTRDDFLRILTEPSGSITRQYKELLAVDGAQVEFTDDGLEELASLAWELNQSAQNIGARRLHTVMERLLESVSYEAPDALQGPIKVDREYVRQELAEAASTEDLSKFIL